MAATDAARAAYERRTARAAPSDLELWSWYFFRASGVLLLLLAFGHMAIMHLIHTVDEIDYAFVAQRWQMIGWRIYDWVLLVLAVLHGQNGVRVVIDDHVRGRRWRRVAHVVNLVLLVFLLVVGTWTVVASGEWRVASGSIGENPMIVKHYGDLIAWQKAMDLVEVVYASTTAFPDAERFGLTSQLRRAAVSVPSNIAEGQGRTSTNEFRHHLSIARGSLCEVETQILIAGRLGYLQEEDCDVLLDLAAEVGRLLRGLSKSLPGGGNGVRPSH